MAGWSMVADGSTLDSAKTPKKLEPSGFWVDLEPSSKRSGVEAEFGNSETDSLRSCFDQLLQAFLWEFCARDCFRPFPPMLGDGQCVDLLKLFVLVREKGGYESVSKNGLWDLVAKESGFGLTGASAVKLVYIKYLHTLEKWLETTVECRSSKSKSSESSLDSSKYLMDLGAEFKEFLSDIPDQKSKEEEYPHLESTPELNVSEVESGGDKKRVLDEESMHLDSSKSAVDFSEVGKAFNDDEAKSAFIDLDGDEKCIDAEENLPLDVTKGVVNSSDVKEFHADGDNDIMILDSGTIKKDIFSNKRKRESVWRMLSWVNRVAKNPCDPVIGSLPDRSKWKSYGNNEFWKQVLVVREATIVKKPLDSIAEQPAWQKNLKMHPCWYDDHVGTSYNLRERLSSSKKLLSAKKLQRQTSPQSSSSGTEGKEKYGDKRSLGTPDSSIADSDVDCEPEKVIPVGSRYQAEVLQWTGVIAQSDSKWLGTRIWPLEKVENKFLIERERIGKGRQDSCGCASRNSIECVRFHIAEKRLRLKLELGVALHHWKFNKMGEEVKLSWTEDEEKKFKAAVRMNPPSLDKCYWDELDKLFPTKSKDDLVSYYFNVFLLQRRAYQNRFTPDNIDSEDDESECGLAINGHGREATSSPNSILRPGRKPQPQKKYR